MIITAPAPPPLSAMLPRCIAHWPDLQRYAPSARIEPLQHSQGWCWGVTVTVFDRSEVIENFKVEVLTLDTEV